ncbi:MAG: acetyl-CoA C-acyltransferase [Balneolales bacterium]
MVKQKFGRRVVLVDGCRIPFQRSGTGYKNLMSYDLAREVLKGLIKKADFKPANIDRIIMGTVIQEVKTGNVARDSALAAGLPHNIPAQTVTMACISSNLAITSGIEAIQTGHADVVIAGGTDTMSDVPIRFSRKLRQKLMESRKMKSPGDYLKLLKGISLADIKPEIPEVAEYTTGESMGQSCDKMAAMFGISRDEQDAFAVRSHQCAEVARRDHLFDEELIPAMVPPNFQPITTDNGIRADSTMEKLNKLSPAFIKPHGTITAGNASFLTDGASAVLIMSEDKAEMLGVQPKAWLKNYTYVAQDPNEELLLGPAYAIPKVLDEAKLTLKDIDVFELHEAFAGQVLSVLHALNSDTFAREKLGRKGKVGEIPMKKLNTMGGSLSLGHPFGATGARLVTTAANRLIREKGKYALVSACAAGGLGHAIILER